jgi:hypothetical protein
MAVSGTVTLGWHAVFFTRKCLHLSAGRTFDEPYPPRPKAFLHVNDQDWPITGESPRLVLEIHTILRPERSHALLTCIKPGIDTHMDQVIIIVSVLLGFWLIGKSSYLLAT